MFVSHLDTVCVLLQMDHRALLAEATQARRAAHARRSSTGRPAGPASIQRRLGSVLVTIGLRLQGVQPAGRARTATAGSGAAS